MAEADNKINGLIGSGVSIEGKLSFDGVLRIDGMFEGEINATGTLVVGEEGVLKSTIKVDTAIISGEVRGMIEAIRKVELHSRARMYGEIRTPVIVLYSGALFVGECLMASKRDTSGLSNEELTQLPVA
ncbi:MAG: polymer-forming cytoskeletal protein [Candidatus Magnetobacterium sp. LHC-1]|uniref:Polymer-forming cytoskeletal protein n=1 Tax=Candidatus Magnetobacterium casense TaxID=1455061 RepID=A0ABS6RY19_9BACT|nr:polymer-forming cytoskeletal protein [Candidatus Magnetobacterium casensis]MBF0608318.1 polymer-forming cytoskeletal protein [Nitrospirota bacterium]MBV6341534.1 polymer-forming cytoskeletal protein [Candidatus Magnetobacterium casensis]